MMKSTFVYLRVVFNQKKLEGPGFSVLMFLLFVVEKKE